MYTRLTYSRICVELASPGYMGFGVHIIINLLPHDRLRDFLFYVELAFPGYLGFGDHLCMNFLSPACLRAFCLYKMRYMILYISSPLPPSKGGFIADLRL